MLRYSLNSVLLKFPELNQVLQDIDKRSLSYVAIPDARSARRVIFLVVADFVAKREAFTSVQIVEHCYKYKFFIELSFVHYYLQQLVNILPDYNVDIITFQDKQSMLYYPDGYHNLDVLKYNFIDAFNKYSTRIVK